MNTTEYAQELKESINADAYATVVRSIGSTLNDRKDRFDKADIIEQTVAAASKNRLVWVDDIGRDHIDTFTGYDIEFKYVNEGLYSMKTGKRKSRVTLRLKNSIGTNKGVEISDPAEYYLIGQAEAMAIISYADLKQYLYSDSDAIMARIPLDVLDFIFIPDDITSTGVVDFDYKSTKAAAQKQLIESVMESLL